MIEKHSMGLTGASGQEYQFLVFPQERALEAEGAVYIVTICNSEEEGASSFNHAPVMLGQTENLNEQFSPHPKAKCFKLAAQALKSSPENIAVGSIIQDDPQKREAIFQDLVGQLKWV